jgi:hypothetical protein
MRVRFDQREEKQKSPKSKRAWSSGFSLVFGFRQPITTLRLNSMLFRHSFLGATLLS